MIASAGGAARPCPTWICITEIASLEAQEHSSSSPRISNHSRGPYGRSWSWRSWELPRRMMRTPYRRFRKFARFFLLFAGHLLHAMKEKGSATVGHPRIFSAFWENSSWRIANSSCTGQFIPLLRFEDAAAHFCYLPWVGYVEYAQTTRKPCDGKMRLFSPKFTPVAADTRISGQERRARRHFGPDR